MANDPLAYHASDAGEPNEGIDLTTLTEEQRLMLRRRRAMASATDNADASHQGGFGAQGGAVDFGRPKNYGLPQ